VPAVLEPLKDPDKFNTTTVLWADHKCNIEWQKNTARLHTFILSPGPSLSGITLFSPSWVILNRACTDLLNNAEMGLGALGELQLQRSK